MLRSWRHCAPTLHDNSITNGTIEERHSTATAVATELVRRRGLSFLANDQQPSTVSNNQSQVQIITFKNFLFQEIKDDSYYYIFMLKLKKKHSISLEKTFLDHKVVCESYSKNMVKILTNLPSVGKLG